MQRIDAATLHRWVTEAGRPDGGELAILDAREEGEFGAAHLFWAVPCPLSRREARARALLPCTATRIVCVDAGGGLAERLADYLASLGCTDLHVLDGGTRDWVDAGYVLFSGVNVPSKAFGEWVEHEYGTESIDAPALRHMIDSGRNMVVLDSRTPEEFHRMSIPTGISVPGAELAYRIAELAPDPETLVVVNCAGRTRSIMGAETLRQAGIPNQVLALRNGTMGWELAGLACDHGQQARYSPGTPPSLGLAQYRAENFADRTGVRSLTAAQLAGFAADPARSLYVLDVRDPEEFAAGHLAGSTSAPGGQLVQATDHWIGVRGARIALIDDTGVRARMTAGWLRLMGHRDVFVVEDGLRATLPARPRPAPLPAEPITAKALADAPDALVVDLARSVDFRDGHIPGAVWLIRTRLAALEPDLRTAPMVVLTSPDGTAAPLAVAELRALTPAPIRVLEGGTRAWAAAGHPLAKDRLSPPDSACSDVYLRPYDRNSGVAEAMQAYLSWEIDLVHEIARDGTVHFGPRP